MLYKKFFRLFVLVPVLFLIPVIVFGILRIISGEDDQKVIAAIVGHCIASVLFMLVSALGKKPNIIVSMLLTTAFLFVSATMFLFSGWVSILLKITTLESFVLLVWFFISAVDYMNGDTNVSHFKG
ncbi:MAG: hypothetical protein J6M18_02310 [Actinomycetaceae bacterium]|nr:hypothetical protein [Actinomycetaceae bacterium]